MGAFMSTHLLLTLGSLVAASDGWFQLSDHGLSSTDLQFWLVFALSHIVFICCVLYQIAYIYARQQEKKYPWLAESDD